VSAEPDEMSAPAGVFLVGYEGDDAVACGGLKRLDATTAEIKRMFVAPEGRGRGLGRRILGALEAEARARGYTRIVLDTAAPLDEAARLYLSAGYREIPAYNDNPYAARWFDKLL
jgi:GNAT superfamily N-acetyltransferase